MIWKRLSRKFLIEIFYKNMEQNIFQEFQYRLRKPWCWSFSLYFIFVIIILGGLGVIFSFITFIDIGIQDIITKEQYLCFRDDLKIIHISSNAATYAIATLAPAIISIILSLFQDDIKNKVSFAIILLVALLLSGFLLYHTITSNGISSLITAAISIIIALFFWIIANYENEYLNDAAFDKKIKDETNRKHGGNWDETK
ncbi:hypothetical protein Barb6_00040 [Bacteroidales bacterium Barb6]|nr:hypothetical protein Barb6_00040 [Bacteroidales bacterium Barb6]